MTLLALTGLLLAAGSPAATPTDANLRAADAEQMRIIVEGDARAQQDFMHPNYIINAPANVIRREPELVADLARGAMRSERFERVTSNLGKLHPAQTLQRRFTNVFLWEGGKWRFLARQASIIVPSADR